MKIHSLLFGAKSILFVTPFSFHSDHNKIFEASLPYSIACKWQKLLINIIFFDILKVGFFILFIRPFIWQKCFKSTWRKKFNMIGFLMKQQSLNSINAKISKSMRRKWGYIRACRNKSRYVPTGCEQ